MSKGHSQEELLKNNVDINFEQLLAYQNYEEFVFSKDKNLEDQFFVIDDMESLNSHWKVLKSNNVSHEYGITF